MDMPMLTSPHLSADFQKLTVLAQAYTRLAFKYLVGPLKGGSHNLWKGRGAGDAAAENMGAKPSTNHLPGRGSGVNLSPLTTE